MYKIIVRPKKNYDKTFEVTEHFRENIAAVRRVLHDSNAKMYVAKNNIFNRAFKLANVPLAELSGPNAIIVAHGDEVIPFKEIHKLMNTYKQVVYKCGIIGKETVGFSIASSVFCTYVTPKLKLSVSVVSGKSSGSISVLNATLTLYVSVCVTFSS